MLIIALLDKKIGEYSKPILVHSKGEALRSLQSEVENPQSVIGTHPEDFDLYHVANFNQVTGHVDALDSPAFMTKALDLRSKGKPNEATENLRSV